MLVTLLPDQSLLIPGGGRVVNRSPGRVRLLLAGVPGQVGIERDPYPRPARCVRPRRPAAPKPPQPPPATPD